MHLFSVPLLEDRFLWEPSFFTDLIEKLKLHSICIESQFWHSFEIKSKLKCWSLWQNQYNIVKLKNKIKNKISIKKHWSLVVHIYPTSFSLLLLINRCWLQGSGNYSSSWNWKYWQSVMFCIISFCNFDHCVVNWIYLVYRNL